MECIGHQIQDMIKFNELVQTKAAHSLVGKKIDNMENFNKEELLVSRIYTFAADKALEAEQQFNITSKEGDLVYNSIITALLYLKDYPKES